MADKRIADLVGKMWSEEISRRNLMTRAAAAGTGLEVAGSAARGVIRRGLTARSANCPAPRFH